ncbi:MFS transporter [Streptomyces syringium]|uniref:MFS family arabinose efflux permease n=1 Tax=Streptomyces syringium TaxID=76729 RepID=A0ABS4XW06_9ACTN|nr:MFS transporter [Streptomyces syringium]MBP2400694.1 putative MFS family arabinose efflux permease [Streptomyces syringium]
MTPLTRARPVWLLALTLAAFAVQTDDYIIIGVLPAISDTVHLSETATGQLVTVYSLTYALAAPVWALLPVRIARKRALCGALTVFSAANFAVLLVDAYPALMALRIVAALAAAMVLPSALAAASAQAPPEQQGRYLATVMTGLTGAVLLGVPAGTWIGAALGWRATFVFGGLLGSCALLMLVRTLPRAEAHAVEERKTLGFMVRPLLNSTVTVILLVTVLTVAGNLAFQTYIASFLSGVSGVTPTVLGVLLVCSGAGGLIGTQVSGCLIDRYSPGRVFALASSVFCGAMVAFAGIWLVRPVPVVLAAVLLVCWSAAAWAVPPSLQSLMLARAGREAAGQAMAVHSSSVYIGAALGGAVGGGVIAAGMGLIPAAAAVLAFLGVVILLPVLRSRTARAALGAAMVERKHETTT